MSEEQEKNNVTAEAGSEVNSDDFSLDNLKSHFETCLAEDGSISIDKYLLGETITISTFECELNIHSRLPILSCSEQPTYATYVINILRESDYILQ